MPEVPELNGYGSNNRHQECADADHDADHDAGIKILREQAQDLIDNRDAMQLKVSPEDIKHMTSMLPQNGWKRREIQPGQYKETKATIAIAQSIQPPDHPPKKDYGQNNYATSMREITSDPAITTIYQGTMRSDVDTVERGTAPREDLHHKTEKSPPATRPKRTPPPTQPAGPAQPGQETHQQEIVSTLLQLQGRKAPPPAPPTRPHHDRTMNPVSQATRMRAQE